MYVTCIWLSNQNSNLKFIFSGFLMTTCAWHTFCKLVCHPGSASLIFWDCFDICHLHLAIKSEIKPGVHLLWFIDDHVCLEHVLQTCLLSSSIFSNLGFHKDFDTSVHHKKHSLDLHLACLIFWDYFDICHLHLAIKSELKPGVHLFWFSDD